MDLDELSLLPEFPGWCRYKIHASVSGPVDKYGRHTQVHLMFLHHERQTLELPILNYISEVLTGLYVNPVT